MSEEPNTTPQSEAPQAGAEGSGTGEAFSQSDLVEVVKRLEGQVRALQGEKDKRINKLEKQAEGLEATIAQYEQYRQKYGDNALREMQIDQLLSGQQAPGAATPAPSQAQPDANDNGDDVETTLSVLGLDANDPNVLQIVARRTGARLTQGLVQYAAQKSQTAKADPSPGSVAAPAGGSVQARDESAIEAFRRELESLPSGRGAADARRRLRRKYAGQVPQEVLYG